MAFLSKVSVSTGGRFLILSPLNLKPTWERCEIFTVFYLHLYVLSFLFCSCILLKYKALGRDGGDESSRGPWSCEGKNVLLYKN